MRTKYNKRRFRALIMIVVILFCMSIGYSYLLTILNIEATSNIKANTWDVHWENVNVKSGSVTGDQVPIAAHILGDTTQVEYSVILENPGDYYEFTVDAKNVGTLDAMVSVVDTKFYESNGVTQISLPNYLEYSFTYADGEEIELNTALAANTSATYKVKIKFKDNLDESQLPTTDKTIIIRPSITYVQADETATPPRRVRYSFLNSAIPLITPETDITISYSTPEEVIAASGYPFFLRHIIEEDTAYNSEIGFKHNGNIYYLKGGEDESMLSQSPIYEHNIEVLMNAFDDSECLDLNPKFECESSNLSVFINMTGEIIVSKTYGFEKYGCSIGENDNNYSAFCGRFVG